MSEIADIIEAQIEKFDALRETFLDENARCFMLKRAQDSGKFTVVSQLTGGWHFRWNEYRQQMRIAYATLDQTFKDKAAQTSYFACGVPNQANEIDVYKIEDDRRDKFPPNGQNPYWKFYVLREGHERFVVPV